MAYLNFSDALMRARRRAALSGRPLTKQETAGIVAGAAETASERAYRSKSLEQQESQFGRSLALSRSQMQAQQRIADKAIKAQERSDIINAGMTGAAIAYETGALSKIGGLLKGGSTAATASKIPVSGAGVTMGSKIAGAGGGSVSAATPATLTAATAGKLVAPWAVVYGLKQGGGEALSDAVKGAGKQGPVGFLDPTRTEPVSKFLKETVFDGCIIVTACTSRNSPEVDVARWYRDNHLDFDQLVGYYTIAEAVVPVLERSSTLRKLTKRLLVDRLVDFGRRAMNPGTYWTLYPVTSVPVTRAFLGTCSIVGRLVNGYFDRKATHGGCHV